MGYADHRYWSDNAINRYLPNAAALVDFSALGVASAIISILADIATPLKGLRDCMRHAPGDGVEAPRTAGGTEVGGLPPSASPQLDCTLLRHILDIVEVFNADAAAEE